MSHALKADFVFELYSEEIPASYQLEAWKSWQQSLPGLLERALLEYGQLEVWATPRRLVVYIQDLQSHQKKVKEVLRGPPREMCFVSGQPSQALLGFAAKAGVSWQEINFVYDGKREYAQAQREKGGQSAFLVLPSLFAELISKTTFPRSMRWGAYDFLYARPLLSYFAMYGRQELVFPQEGLWKLVKHSHGVFAHSYCENQLYKIEKASDYYNFLQKKNIWVDPQKRKEYILQQLHATAKKEGLFLVENPELLEEVTFLVEAPQVLCGSFPEKFLKLPRCVILSEMQQHQRYFGLQNEMGELASRFLIVANLPNQDIVAQQNVIEGNERVIKARLEDGAFYYEEDRRTPLWQKAEELGKIIFLENLGTMKDKARRLAQHAQSLQRAGVFPYIPESTIERAALLCKADLATKLVYEFDHLQGEIGSIYAAMDGESYDIVHAIFEHYLPRNQGDLYPQTPLGILLSLCDKLDNICAGFLTNKEPTASTDPLGLRRQAIYILEIILKNNLSFSFTQLLPDILAHFENLVSVDKSVAEAIWDFLRARYVTIFEKDGFDRSLIQAGIFSESDDIKDLYLRISAIRQIKEKDSENEFRNLLLSFKRMKNIVEDFKKKFPFETIPTSPKEELFVLPEEKKLYELALALREKIDHGKNEKNYYAVFSYLAQNKKIIDLFFDRVMVMHEDRHLRDNRLALLLYATEKVQSLVNLSLLGT
ncbi:MAG: glycine--tRNA ligase subunit beta [Leptospiraceae bacterium]|nr:glycine--tRNA ligase subunit beta [Leptospiraceae bacterium]MDW8306493.1 glycine--tRNA ligase subunit beta [Leptospiraceae bacterium]